MSQSSNASGGLGLTSILTIVFVVLKLAEVGVIATWSWWWVLSPLWIGAGLGLGIWLFVLIIMGLVFGLRR
tara:strand:+ start:109 stop:321 length:213 start_codon:yes stop_codon:yes gene_type:complete